MTARGRLQRAAVRFAERRQAGAPGDVVELEAAAREFASGEQLVEQERAFLAVYRRLRPKVDISDLLADVLDDDFARWRAVGRQLRKLAPDLFRATLVANEGASQAIKRKRARAERRARGASTSMPGRT